MTKSIEWEIFGIKWSFQELIHYNNNPIYIVNRNDFGTILITDYAKFRILEIGGNESFKYLSILRERFLKKKKVLLCIESEKAIYLNFQEKECISIEEILNNFPSSISEKIQRSLLNIYKIKPDYGKYVEHLKPYDVFAKDNEELIFILNILKNKSYIIHDYFLNAGSLMWKKGAIIQEQGWLGIEHLELPLTSNKVFIAMWFDPSLDDAFLKMQMACDGNGFIGDRISNKEHNNEISGEILYEIRRSRFLIADVTGQRHGVYFEAGYAMGLGIPVIWSCREDHFKDVHFDTRQYNHVVWTDEKDLLEKLEKRIKGTIL